MPALVIAISMFVSANFILIVPPPFYLGLIVGIRTVVGGPAFREMMKNRVKWFGVFDSCASTATVFIFPVYEMLVIAAQGTHYQFPTILLLPVIKVALKNLVLLCAKALEDMAPVEVIFMANFFNTIYVATRM